MTTTVIKKLSKTARQWHDDNPGFEDYMPGAKQHLLLPVPPLGKEEKSSTLTVYKNTVTGRKNNQTLEVFFIDESTDYIWKAFINIDNDPDEYLDYYLQDPSFVPAASFPKKRKPKIRKESKMFSEGMNKGLLTEQLARAIENEEYEKAAELHKKLNEPK